MQIKLDTSLLLVAKFCIYAHLNLLTLQLENLSEWIVLEEAKYTTPMQQFQHGFCAGSTIHVKRLHHIIQQKDLHQSKSCSDNIIDNKNISFFPFYIDWTSGIVS